MSLLAFEEDVLYLQPRKTGTIKADAEKVNMNATGTKRTCQRHMVTNIMDRESMCAHTRSISHSPPAR